ncbi:MAG: CrcB family protein [Microbacteriaceae bacterium]
MTSASDAGAGDGPRSGSRGLAAGVAAVAVGGMLGTGARLGLDAVLPHPDAGWAWSTLIANVLGSVVLGLLVARVWPTAPEWMRAGLGAGVLGAFTTFSAVAVAAVAMTEAGAGPLALAYVALSVALGLAGAFAGLALGARGGRRAGRSGPPGPSRTGSDA